MHFDEEFLKSLPEEPFSAIRKICEKYSDVFSKLSDTSTRYPLIVEFYALIAAYSEANGLGINVPKVEGEYPVDAKQAGDFVEHLQSETSREMGKSAFQRYKDSFATGLGGVFHYEFSKGDLDNIQELLNKLRDLISESQELGEDHKHRLLKKLERLQSELHKKVSDLDRFWGFFIDASIVVGLMGENAKPMVDVIKKIVGIIWPTQTRAYELPSDFPFKLLGQAEDDKKDDAGS